MNKEHAEDKGSRPAAFLSGLTLSEGWSVDARITPPAHATGGRFSVGYIAKNQNGQVGYLKALDFSIAAQRKDFTGELESMVVAYNFEKSILNKCKERKLGRIVMPVADGYIEVPGCLGPLARVPYLIFECADGDIRDELAALENLDLAWCLRSLHHTAVGIRQLHSTLIAHQDLKPSNVLVFKDEGSKIGDLGRASTEGEECPTDGYMIPGDVDYAPPEQFYKNSSPRTFEDRCLADLYMLGSLIYFYFSACSMTSSIQSNLANAGLRSNESFEGDLPYIRGAFAIALDQARPVIEAHALDLTNDIVELIERLCEPDPSKRGDPRKHSGAFQRYDIERFVSRLNLLAEKAELSFS